MSYEPQTEQAADYELETLNVLITGKSGGGKTCLGATMENPLILLLEEQGRTSIKAVAPLATVVMINGLDAEGNRLVDAYTQKPLTPWDHLGLVFAWAQRMINAGKFPYEGIVLDTFHEAQYELAQKLLGPRQAQLNKDKEASAEEVVATLSREEYRTLGNRSLQMIRWLKKLPVDVAVLTKAEEVVDGEELVIRPAAMGQMAPAELPYHFNLVVYCYKAIPKEGGRPDYLVLTDGHSKYTTKGHPALDPVEGQNLDYMIKRIKGSPGAGLIKPAGPPEGAEGSKPLPPEPSRQERPGAHDARKQKEEKDQRKGKGKKGTGKPPPPKSA